MNSIGIPRMQANKRTFQQFNEQNFAVLQNIQSILDETDFKPSQKTNAGQIQQNLIY